MLIVHWCDGVSAFPRTSVRVGVGSALSVVEVFAGAEGTDRSLVVPVTELAAADGASLSYVSLQILGGAAWSIARLAGRGTANSTLRTFTVGLGASDHRVRADVSVEGKDARSEILSAYLGDGTQVHDIRTLQDHVAPRTTSELLCQGAVAGTSRSVYSGADPGAPRGRVERCAPDQSQPRPRRGSARRFRCPTSTSWRTTSAAPMPPRWDRSTRTSATTLSPGASRPKWPRGSSCVGFFDAIIDRSPVPAVIPFLQRVCTSVSTSWWVAEHCPPVSETVALCAIEDLASGQARRFDVSGHRIALVRIGYVFYAVDDECSHEDYSLSEGEVWAAECEIECPRHGSMFDLRSGKPRSLPATQPVAVYEVKLEGGTVAVVLP